MKSSKKLLFGKTLLIAFIGTIVVTILIVYLTGLTSHRSLLDNSIIALTILTVCFLAFLSFGLFNGLNVKDNYSHKLKLTWRNALKLSDDGSWTPDLPSNIEAPDLGDGIAGVILGILLWILVSIVIVWLLISLQAIIWITIILLIAAIYWVLIRALKLIFRKSTECEGNISKSLTYAVGYTVLYVGWIYGIVYISNIFGT